MGFLVLGNPKQRQVSTTRNLMDTDCFHKVNLMDTACFYQGNPMNTWMQDTTKNECIFTLIRYACPYMHVTSQLFSPAHSPSELAPIYACAANDTPGYLLLVAQALDASCIYTDKIRYFFQEWV